MLALAGAFVLAFRKPIRQEIVPFRDPLGLLERKEGSSFWLDCGGDCPACRMISILSETAGAREEA